MTEITMTREDHLKWCKRRALEYLDSGDVHAAIASMMSDMGKHAETKHAMTAMMPLGLMYAAHRDVEATRKWIIGFR